MYVELLPKLNKTKLNIWKSFLKKCDLEPDGPVDRTALIWDNDVLIATGSRCGNLLKLIAIDQSYQGQGLTATLISTLKKDAFSEGVRHLFVYTKPKNKMIFEDLFFYPVAQTEKVILMEDKKDGINNFLENLHVENVLGNTGCIVMNCNPFTLGHRYLIETASKECDTLFVFVVSEDKSRFSSQDRIEMVRRGTADINNVKVLPTGPYLISSVTFPTYFLKERENVSQIKCHLDIEIFAKYYATKFNINTRFVGTEPLSPMTALYNNELKKLLPTRGIEVKEIKRLEASGTPISASRVRTLIDEKNTKELKELLYHTTYDFLMSKGLI